MRSKHSQSFDAKEYRRICGKQPADVESVNRILGLFKGIMHGDTAEWIDVELPNMKTAIAFFETDSEGWDMEIITPITFSNLTEVMERPVTVSVRKGSCAKNE